MEFVRIHSRSEWQGPSLVAWVYQRVETPENKSEIWDLNLHPDRCSVVRCSHLFDIWQISTSVVPSFRLFPFPLLLASASDAGLPRYLGKSPLEIITLYP